MTDALSRRGLFRLAGLSGMAALGLLAAEEKSAAAPLPTLPHFTPKAKRVIILMMAGGASQLDTFDHKPGLAERFNQDLPPSVLGGQQLTGMTSHQTRLPIAPSKFAFKQHGRCGTWVSELLPATAGIVDELAVIRSMHTDAINHDPAITLFQTGNMVNGKPCLGAWLSHGLGTLNRDLPTFVVMRPSFPAGSNAQALMARLWGSGFLSSEHAGVSLRSQGAPVLYLDDPPGMDRDRRRLVLDLVQGLNRRTRDLFHDPETAARIAQYEMAFRMQRSVPELTAIADEPSSTFALYGEEARKPGSFANTCLLARRMCERGVRVVEILHRGWDQHGALPKQLTNQCRDTDRGCAALVQDLKRRGLLEDTLVVWCTEFGRTVYSQGHLTKDDYGRDHHPRCFTVWLAGAGVRRGIVHGESDEFGYNIVKDGVHVRDFNATVLHLLGLDHERFTVKAQGLDQRLTGVEQARVVQGILA